MRTGHSNQGAHLSSIDRGDTLHLVVETVKAYQMWWLTMMMGRQVADQVEAIRRVLREVEASRQQQVNGGERCQGKGPAVIPHTIWESLTSSILTVCQATEDRIDG